MRFNLLVPFLALAVAAPAAAQTSRAVPIDFGGETFTIESRALGEVRRINVYRPPAYGEAEGAARPVLYMPDGGVAEDYMHIAGLLQISVLNGTMRPFILVGIENTQRRRDMTGPTTVETDRAIAPVVGGSAAFRAFIRDELIPAIDRRYTTTDERAIVGESLAGLFVVETFFREPALFDTYLAFDPSLWWNANDLVEHARARLVPAMASRRIWLASSDEPTIGALTIRLAALLTAESAAQARFEPMREESHGSIYHPAALRAFRALFPLPAEVDD